MTETTDATSIYDAIRHLDPDGGWDWERFDWPYSMIRALREAEKAGYTEYGTSFDIPHWRLTDDGIVERKRLENVNGN
jgi:hypothetical protein